MIEGQLAGHAELMAQLGLASSKLTKDFGDRTSFNTICKNNKKKI